MNGVQSFAGFLALALVSNVALSDNKRVDSSPMTASDLVQCRGHVTEINQSIAAHNALVTEARALRTEIETLRKELDIEEASVDRTSGDAMDALNAKILKNNEMVLRHESLSKLIKEMADTNTARIAIFKAACESRPMSAPSTPVVPAAVAPAADPACKTSIGTQDVQHQIEATFAEMRADQKQRQSEVERVADARASAEKWSKEKRSSVWMSILASPRFAALEQEKRPYLQELMNIATSNPKTAQERCQLVKRIAATLPAIKALNAKQYTFMADQIRSSK